MIRNVDARQAAAWLAAGEAVLVDVREPDEFKASHIPAAVSVPLASVPGALAQLGLPQGKRLVFQCQKGSRGAQACAIVGGTAGETYNLEGGIEAWRAAGLPLVGGAAPGLSIFRQVQIVVGTLVAVMTGLGFAGWTAGFALAGFFGFMLAFAGATGWCGLALLLSRMPWNRPVPNAA
jgi:rhodanese-related sulfurtransferase